MQVLQLRKETSGPLVLHERGWSRLTNESFEELTDQEEIVREWLSQRGHLAIWRATCDELLKHGVPKEDWLSELNQIEATGNMAGLVAAMGREEPMSQWPVEKAVAWVLRTLRAVPEDRLHEVDDAVIAALRAQFQTPHLGVALDGAELCAFTVTRMTSYLAHAGHPSAEHASSA